jgi:hypothetical protein
VLLDRFVSREVQMCCPPLRGAAVAPAAPAEAMSRSPAHAHSADYPTAARHRVDYRGAGTRRYAPGAMYASSTDDGIGLRGESHHQKHEHETKCQILHFRSPLVHTLIQVFIKYCSLENTVMGVAPKSGCAARLCEATGSASARVDT